MTQTLKFSTTVLCTAVSPDPSEALLRLDDTGLTVRGPELAEAATLAEIFDVRIGRPPQAARQAFSGTVLTVGFERGGQHAVLFVDGEETTLERVRGVLFRRLLDGTEVAMCHPATIGGRVTTRRFDIGELRVTPGKVGCTGIKQPLHIDIGDIVAVSRSERELLGRLEPTVELRYVKHGVVVGVYLSLNPPRKLNLLGRLLRSEYRHLTRQLHELDPPTPVVRVLTRLYSRGGSTDSGAVLAAESTDPESLLRTLRSNDLVELVDGTVRLTMRGWILVIERVGTVTVPYHRPSETSGDLQFE